jgi:hypothetical protein
MNARRIIESEVKKCSAVVPSPGMNFYRPRQCQRPGVVQRDGKWYCSQHDPEMAGERERRREASAKERTRMAILMKYNKNRRLGEGKNDRIYWRDLGDKDKVIETETGFGVMLSVEDRIPIYWNLDETEEAVAALRERANFKTRGSDTAALY